MGKPAASESPPGHGYPNEHIGALTPEEQRVFDQFRTALSQRERQQQLASASTAPQEKQYYYRPASDGQHASCDDPTLLRYLRARRFDVEAAVKQFVAAEDWRRDNRITDLYQTCEIDKFLESRGHVAQWTGRRDRRGLPVYWYSIKALAPSNITRYRASTASMTVATDGRTDPVLVRMLGTMLEHEPRFVFPLCTALGGDDKEQRPFGRHVPITQSVSIVDCAGVSYSWFWALSGLMREGIVLSSNHYPEMEDVTLLIGAPIWLATVWNIVKGWFDAGSATKLHIVTPSTMKATLERYIDPTNIPRAAGGSLDWAFDEPAVLDPAVDDVVEWLGEYRDFPPGPMAWEAVYSEDEAKEGSGVLQDIVAVALGAVEGKPRRERVCRLKVGKERLGELASLMTLM